MNAPQQPDPRRGGTSASNAQADLLCPGRHNAQRGIPEPPSTDDAERGTRVHACLCAQSIEGNKGLQTLSLEERELYDACREIEQTVATQFLGSSGPPYRVFREQRYWSLIPAVPGQKPGEGVWFEHSGQVDAVHRRATKALIVDYKTGRLEVAESSRNLQLRDLACLVRGHFVVIDEIACVVVQPLVTRKPEITLYVRDDINRAEREMFARVLASNQVNAQRLPGEAQCKYCRAKGVCFEYQRWAGSMVPAMLSVLDVPIAQWDAQHKAAAAAALPVARKLLDNIEDGIKASLVADAESVPGFYLKPGNEVSVITNPQECFNRFSTMGGKVEQFMGAVKIQKGKLREAVHDVTGAKGMALDKACRSLTEGLVEVKQNSPSLARKEDA